MDDVELEFLRECYNAVLLRRVERGRRSIRTRQGYERLRSKYHPQLRFLHDTEAGGTGAGTNVRGDEPSEKEDQSKENSAVTEGVCGGEEDTERTALENVVDVYVDSRIKRFITDVCWPLAHFGGGQSAPTAPCRQVRFRSGDPTYDS